MNYIKLYEPFFGCWQLEEEIGQDRLGKVYKISKNDWDKKYESILKIISITDNNNDNNDSENCLLNSIDSELKTLSSLNKNILNYKDHSIVKRFDDAGYDILIRMDYQENLSNYLLKHRLTKKDVIELGIDICLALEECHSHNILHKNISPNTIFLNNSGKFCLGNFDLSIDRDTLLNNPKNTESYFYMAPEVFNLGEFSKSSDLYSLGIILYKLLNNNKLPFLDSVDDNPKISLFKRLSSEDISCPKNASLELSKIILKAISFDIYKRYKNATEMKNDLIAYLESFNEPDLYITIIHDKPSHSPDIAFGNNINGNLIDYSNGDIYIVNLSDFEKIYKIHEHDNTYTKLSDDHATNIKYYKDYIYYINKSDNDNIYRINCNSYHKKLILKEEVSNMLFYNDWIYYTSYDNKLYRIKPDGLDKMCIIDDKCAYFNIYKDTIFYSNMSDNYSIYKFNITTQNKVKLNDTPSYFINIYKKQIFYANTICNKIYRMELDGSGKCIVANIGAKYINIYNNYIFFSNTDDYNNLYKIGIDGLNLHKITNDYTEQINIFNNWIYYKNSSDNGSLYKVRADGTERTKVLPLINNNFLFLK